MGYETHDEFTRFINSEASAKELISLFHLNRKIQSSSADEYFGTDFSPVQRFENMKPRDIEHAILESVNLPDEIFYFAVLDTVPCLLHKTLNYNLSQEKYDFLLQAPYVYMNLKYDLVQEDRISDKALQELKYGNYNEHLLACMSPKLSMDEKLKILLSYDDDSNEYNNILCSLLTSKECPIELVMQKLGQKEILKQKWLLSEIEEALKTTLKEKFFEYCSKTYGLDIETFNDAWVDKFLGLDE